MTNTLKSLDGKISSYDRLAAFFSGIGATDKHYLKLFHCMQIHPWTPLVGVTFGSRVYIGPSPLSTKSTEVELSQNSHSVLPEASLPSLQ